MKSFIVYDDTTGQILRKGNCGDDEVEYQAIESNELVLEVLSEPFFNLHYVDLVSDPHLIQSKTESPAVINKLSMTADGVDSIVIDDIPNPTTITIIVPEGATKIDPVVVDDGDLSFTCNFKGTYVFKLDSVPHLEKIFTITAS